MDELLRKATATVLRNISSIGPEEFTLLRQAVIREHGRRTIPDPCEKCWSYEKGLHIPSAMKIELRKCCCGNCFQKATRADNECQDCPWREK